MAEVTLALLGEQLACILNEMTGFRGEMAALRGEMASVRETAAEIKDEMLVQGSILARLEHRDRTIDGDQLKLLQQIQRLDRRVRALEEKTNG